MAFDKRRVIHRDRGADDFVLVKVKIRQNKWEKTKAISKLLNLKVEEFLDAHIDEVVRSGIKQLQLGGEHAGKP
jgi:hypothetical protein